MFTARQIADALAVNLSTLHRRAAAESWPFEKRQGRGGGKLFPAATLPADVRARLAEARHAPDAPAPDIAPDQPAIPAPHLKDWQRDVRDARLAVLAEVRKLAEIGGSILAAEAHFSRLAARGDLSPHFSRLVAKANARRGSSRALSPATLRLWRRTLGQQGPDALAPRPAASARPAIPAWLPPLLDLYRRPTKPSLAYCYGEVAKVRRDLPSLRTVERTVARLGELAVAPGRMLPRELKSLRAYVKRDFEHLLPADVYTADGHTLDAEVLHPVHGRPFRPEVVSVLDVATRRCVGWSVGLAESSWLVADAVRMATEQGVAAIFYVDNGCGFKNALLEGPGLGILTRLGTTFTHSLPYNSQARGVIERFQGSCWVRAAKSLPAYMGAAMDREARQKVFKASRKDLATLGSTRLLLPWERFMEWAAGVVAAYNARPHSSLPMIQDPATGKRRRMSPDECWAAKAGAAEIIVPAAAECADLFRPYEVRRVVRAVVSLGSKEYFNKALELYTGQEVQVGYDIHDPSRVWVRDLDGRLICEAGLDAHAKPYFPRSVVEEAREKRAQGRLRRLAAREAEVRAELDGGPLAVEAKPTPQVIELDPSRREALADLACRAVAEAAAPRVAAAMDTREQRQARAQAIEAGLAAGRPVDPADADWLAGYRTTPEYKAARKLADYYGRAAM